MYMYPHENNTKQKEHACNYGSVNTSQQKGHMCQSLMTRVSDNRERQPGRGKGRSEMRGIKKVQSGDPA